MPLEATMQKYKSYLASKTVWAAIIAAALGGYKLVAPSYHWDVSWVPGVEYVLGAFGLYGLRTATTTLGTPPTTDNVVPGGPK
jgi:hypothetical protein